MSATSKRLKSIPLDEYYEDQYSPTDVEDEMMISLIHLMKSHYEKLGLTWLVDAIDIDRQPKYKHTDAALEAELLAGSFIQYLMDSGRPFSIRIAKRLENSLDKISEMQERLM